MIIECVTAGPLQTNTYLVGCDQERVACIIDPALKCSERLGRLIDRHQLTIQGIYLTHSHFDHFADAAYLKREFGFPIHVHEADSSNVQKPGSDGIPNLWNISGVAWDHFLSEGQVIKLGTLEFSVIHTPGHSPGGVCFYFEKQGVLFSDDVLFKGTYGNVSLPTSDPELMRYSLQKLMLLPDETKVYPGHGEPTTIGSERQLYL